MHDRADTSNTNLARQQARFVANVFDSPVTSGPFGQREGIAVYRRNLLAVAEAALAVTYPSVRRLLGQGDFAALTDRLLALHPPVHGDWGEWGEELPLLVEHSRQGRRFPFIAPVAQLDWLRNRANRAADNRFDRSSARLLETHEVDLIGIGIASYVGLTSSRYPLVDILEWHSDGSPGAGSMCLTEAPRPVLVFRREFRVEQVYISATEDHFLRGLQVGRSIGHLLDELAGKTFDFPDWVERALHRNLISHFYLIQEN